MASGAAKHLLSCIADVARGDSTRGLIMIGCALVAFLWANSPWAADYVALSDTQLGIGFGNWRVEESLVDWVNDGLMAVFFFVVGLEIKREFLEGQLSSARDASLAVFAAIGGMALPIACYLVLNWGGEGMSGWGGPHYRRESAGIRWSGWAYLRHRVYRLPLYIHTGFPGR